MSLRKLEIAALLLGVVGFVSVPSFASSMRGSTAAIAMVHWRSSIWGAAMEPDTARLEALLKKSPAALDQLDPKGNTPLFWAASKGNLPAVTLLLSKHADVKTANRTGDTALHAAVEAYPVNGDRDGKFLKAIASLLDHGADPMARNLEGKTPIDLARGEAKDLMRGRLGLR